MDVLIYILGGIVATSLFFYGISCFEILNEYESGIKLSFGKFVGELKAGLHFALTGFQQIIRVDTRISVIDIPPQEAITKDNVSVKVNGVVYYQVLKPVDAVLKVQDYITATAQFAQATLKDICGQFTLDELLSKRDEVAETIKGIVDKGTEKWGIDIPKVALTHIELPESMKQTLGKVAEAEREKQATLIRSSGEFEAARNLAQASATLANSPGAMQLRTLQMLSEISGDPNSKIIVPIPFQLLDVIDRLAK